MMCLYPRVIHKVGSKSVQGDAEGNLHFYYLLANLIAKMFSYLPIIFLFESGSKIEQDFTNRKHACDGNIVYLKLYGTSENIKNTKIKVRKHLVDEMLRGVVVEVVVAEDHSGRGQNAPSPLWSEYLGLDSEVDHCQRRRTSILF